jgi:hypothetical protein
MWFCLLYYQQLFSEWLQHEELKQLLLLFHHYIINIIITDYKPEEILQMNTPPRRNLLKICVKRQIYSKCNYCILKIRIERNGCLNQDVSSQHYVGKHFNKKSKRVNNGSWW